MSDIPDALVEKAAHHIDTINPEMVSTAEDCARAVLAAVWPDLPAARPVVDRDALAEALHERFALDHEDHWRDLDDDEKRRTQAWDQADAILASGVVQEPSEVVCGVRMTSQQAEALRANLRQDAADVRRAVAEEIAVRCEEATSVDPAILRGTARAARIAREASEHEEISR